MGEKTVLQEVPSPFLGGETSNICSALLGEMILFD